jgi:hypothetical protein
MPFALTAQRGTAVFIKTSPSAIQVSYQSKQQDKHFCKNLAVALRVYHLQGAVWGIYVACN